MFSKKKEGTRQPVDGPYFICQEHNDKLIYICKKENECLCAKCISNHTDHAHNNLELFGEEQIFIYLAKLYA